MYSEKKIKISLAYLLLIFLSCSCTTKYSSPYSAQNIAHDLSKKYSTEIEVVAAKKAGFFEGNKSNEYLLRDKKRGFLFEAGSYVKMDRHIPLHKRNRWDCYTLGLMRHYHDDVLQLADKYEIRLSPPPLLTKSKSFPEIYSWARDDDSVFIHSGEELRKVADLYLELAYLYNFTCKVRPPSGFPEFVLNYAQPQNPDSIVRICRLPYLFSKDSLVFSSSKRKGPKYINTNYVPKRLVIYNELYESWNKAVDEGLISEEKVRYKQYDSPVFGLIDYDEEKKGHITVTNVSGTPVSIFFQHTDPERFPQNISALETVITNNLYKNYLQAARPVLEENLEENLKSNGEGFDGQVHLAEGNLTEQFPLYSVIVRNDGSMIVCYKISFVADFRLLLMMIDIDGKCKGCAVSSVGLSLFNNLSINDFSEEDFNSFRSTRGISEF